MPVLVQAKQALALLYPVVVHIQRYRHGTTLILADWLIEYRGQRMVWVRLRAR